LGIDVELSDPADSLTINKCSFTGNTAGTGGAIYVSFSQPQQRITVSLTSFIQNTAPVGAAIATNSSTIQTLSKWTDIVFEQNVGSTIISNQQQLVVFAGSSGFSKNTASNLLVDGPIQCLFNDFTSCVDFEPDNSAPGFCKTNLQPICWSRKCLDNIDAQLVNGVCVFQS